MANGDTKTNQYLDIAAHGEREDFPASCCETRSQTLIREVGERIMDIEEEVERLENNPDVVDIVATYAELQNYDTSGLTDKDIIRVLEDETHDENSTYYRWNAATNRFDFVGEIAGGTEYTAGDGIDIMNDIISATNTGKARELTATDYNWPADNPDGVAAWLLEPGLYYAENAQVYMSSNQIGDIIGHGTFIIGDDYGSNPTKLILYYDQNAPAAYLISTVISSGYRNSKISLLPPNVTQSTGTSTTSVMSQNATTSMVYADPSTKRKVQIGANANAGGDYAISVGQATYAGSYGVAIGQSAHANTNTCGIAIGGSPNQFYPARVDGIYGIAIGGGDYNNNGAYVTSYGSYAIAIGTGASTAKAGSIALGAFSTVTSVGEMNIGSSSTSYGYNSSNYRLLSGVYDPQSAHDAATKGYVDPTTDSSAPTTATVGRLGQIQIDTTTSTAYMCVAVDDVTPAYTWKQITA